MNKQDFTIKPSDSPQEIEKKVKNYFYIAIAAMFFMGLWPVAIMLFLLQSKILEEATKAINKQMAAQNKEPVKLFNNELVSGPKTKRVRKEAVLPPKNVVKVDQGRSWIAIISFIILIAVLVGLYYIPKLLENLN